MQRYKTVKGNGKQLFKSWLQINLNSSLFLYLEALWNKAGVNRCKNTNLMNLKTTQITVSVETYPVILGEKKGKKEEEN